MLPSGLFLCKIGHDGRTRGTGGVIPPDATLVCVVELVMYRYAYRGLAWRAPGFAVTGGVAGRTGGVVPFLEGRLATIATAGPPPIPSSGSFQLALTAGLKRRW
jgi:hypothetical protein